MNLWTFISAKLQSGQAVQLLTVIESKGSSPGRQGFKLALAADGAWTGTIGGGIMEHTMLEKAAELLREEAEDPVLVYQNHHPDATEHGSGLNCMGNQRIAFVPLGGAEASIFDKIIAALDEGRPGMLQLSPEGINFQEDTSFAGELTFRRASDADWLYEEPVADPPTLYIFGGGHVSLALSRQFSFLGFRIALFDDRPELALFRDNPYTWRKEVVDYQDIGHLIPEGPQVYVVIMTAGHASDGCVLEQLLGKKVRYLGMLGSKGKAHTLFQQFREKSIPEDVLARVYTPIGLPIRSRTPEEIAVSIAAEIIQVKNEKGKN